MGLRTLLVAAPLAPGRVEVSGAEAHHARDVLRLRPGDAVRLCDGAGRQGAGTVAEAAPGRLAVTLAEVETATPPSIAGLTIACALPKGERAADLVRMLTEIGVGALRPLVTARGERASAPERLARVAAEALKQCRRAHALILLPPLPVAALAADSGRLMVADPHGSPLRPGAPGPATVAIGPEGGFTEAELGTLLAAGAEPARLGPHVMRIETAAVCAAAACAAAWEHP
jgi:16S rRNA (uracil1498-N3)-methyltransferase